MKRKKLTLTVGIATCFGSVTLLDTVKSLRSSKNIEEFRLIIVADRTPISPDTRRKLKNYRVELVENKYISSQMSKQKQFIAMSSSDLLIITQDDVLFDSNTLNKVVREFEEDTRITMISILNKPIKPENVFEEALGIGTNIVNRIATSWNNGDSYLAVIGRFIAFRTNFLKEHIDLDNKISTCDAYYYFSNKRAGGTFKYLSSLAVHFKNPEYFREHLRKSSRFQYSKSEMLKYFKDLDFEKEYKCPKSVIAKAMVREFFSKPVLFLYYCLIFISSRLFKIKIDEALNTIWEIDLSTKKILNRTI